MDLSQLVGTLEMKARVPESWIVNRVGDAIDVYTTPRGKEYAMRRTSRAVIRSRGP